MNHELNKIIQTILNLMEQNIVEAWQALMFLVFKIKESHFYQFIDPFFGKVLSKKIPKEFSELKKLNGLLHHVKIDK